MLGIHDFWLFVVSGLVLNITPGPDTAYIVGRSAQFGWRGGAAATLGISTGCLVHVFACAVGLSALLAASATAFNLIKWAGAAYLCFIGIRMLLARGDAPVETPSLENGAMSPSKVFWQGALTNILNPKVALFFLAFLPQFVDPARGSTAVQIVVLGLIFDTTGTMVNTIVALGASGAAERMHANSKSVELLHRITGVIFIGLGIRIALASRR